MSRTGATVGIAIAVLAHGCAGDPPVGTTAQASHGESCDWDQWGGGAAHAGAACATAQDMDVELGHVTMDPFVDAAVAEAGGPLLIHYQVPLIADKDVYVLRKTGTYTACDPPGSGEPFPCGLDAPDSQIWNETAYRWKHGALVEQWTFESDWKSTRRTQWEQMFQPAIAGNSLYVPGANGSVYRVNRNNGHLQAQIRPFGSDPGAQVWGGVTADRHGNIYYNVVTSDPDDPFGDITGAWLVRINKHDHVAMVDYTTLIPNAPAPDDLCYTSFAAMHPRPPRPWPPPPQPDGSPTLPPQAPCGTQRPGLNVTPAIGDDGTIFTATNGLATSGYLVALHPNLSLAWARALDGLNDGCGVLATCREGATPGVDPNTNLPPVAFVNDVASSSPVALPDGGVVLGAFTGYNGGRGHLFRYSHGGDFLGTFDFGWDVTPAVYRHDHSYSIVIKNNDYVNEVFQMSQLSPDLAIEWSFLHTNTETCERQPDGTISCVDNGEHPNGFEWCMNAPAVDDDGTVFGTSEDGNLYAIGQGGVEVGRFFLDATRAAAYTPTAIDDKGRIYGLNNGELSIVGEGDD